jgi:hypothetical protein
MAWERDPVIVPGAHGRADVASGRMAKWMRFNNPESLIWLDNLDGQTIALTRNQYWLFEKVRSLSGRALRVTMRELAAELGVSPSTMWRNAVKLAALGLIAYQSNRGRHGGSMFILRATKDGLEWFRDAAKAKVRAWRKASEERISRLRRNVASCFPGREKELYQYRYTSTDTGRNISFADDVAEWVRELL